jgi:hypothetical protein
MAKIEHPWQVGPTELIEFALERLHTGSDVDRRLAFLILDVGVETLFKTYLTLPSSVVQYQTNRKERDTAVNGNFHELLDGVQKSDPEKAVKFNFAHIQHYHKLRNMLYHEGNQVTAVRHWQSTCSRHIWKLTFRKFSNLRRKLHLYHRQAALSRLTRKRCWQSAHRKQQKFFDMS